MQPEITPHTSAQGLRVRDPAENVQLELTTDPVTLTDTSASDFIFPVDITKTFDTSFIRIPKLVQVYIRTPDGDLEDIWEPEHESTYDAGRLHLELNPGPLKFFLITDGPLSISPDGTTVMLSFSETQPVKFGVRSLHKSPHGTITTPATPDGIMRAVSYLGSAIKTHNPERSFPTLRGHPPLIELGETFDVPDHLNKPETGITLELPPECRYIYPAATLAYYLGATLNSNSRPRIRADDWHHDFPTGSDFQSAIERFLKRIFFLDCLVRTEGIYPVDLHERREFAKTYDLDFAGLYEASEADRLAAYLDVPYRLIEPHLPTWKSTTDIQPLTSHADVLPYLAQDLSVIRCPNRTESVALQQESEAITDFYRNDVDDPTTRGTVASFVQESGFRLEPTESLEHAWVGEGSPVGASKVTRESLRQRFENVTSERSPISVTIVCNDPEMSAEETVQDYYGLRDFIHFEVDVEYELTTDELATTLETGCDFLHYIGHVDDTGFQCTDGMLDATHLDTVNVDAFLLNACRSYTQGRALVEHGSLGGITTLSKVLNEPAVEMGRTIARALNEGHSLQSALALTRRVSTYANQYISVGDGNLQLTKSVIGTLFLTEMAPLSESKARFLIHTHPSSPSGMGSLVHPHISGNTTQYLNSGLTDEFVVSASEIQEFFELGRVPVIIEDDLYWSDTVNAGHLLQEYSD